MASYTSRLITLCRWTFPLAITTICTLVWPQVVFAQSKSKAVSIRSVDHVMYVDPAFLSPRPKFVVSTEPVQLWLQGLQQPNTDTQRSAVDSFAIAHRRGMTGLHAVIPELVELLARPNLDESVRRATIRTLIKLDARDHVSVLAEQSKQFGAPIRTLVEPALVHWQSDVFADDWVARLDQPGVDRQSLIVAINGLGAIEHTDATEKLIQIAENRFIPNGIRIAAASAIGSMHQSGMNSRATQWSTIQPFSPVDQMMAVKLLARHTDAETLQLLKSLMPSENSAVKALAIKRIYEIDSNAVLELVTDYLSDTDLNVRRTLAHAMIDSKRADQIAPLAKLLDDVNPGLRREVAAALVNLSNENSLRDTVISEVSGILDQDSWRGCEQAGLVLVSMGHKPAGDRLVDLMDHPRGEVMITAGWGLRVFADQKHLPSMLGRAQAIYEGFRSNKISIDTPGPTQLIAQLFQAFAKTRYKPADELMRKYVPRNFSLGDDSRASAAYLAGYLYLGKSPKDLVDILVARLADVESMETERDEVRRNCAISLGRMNAESALPTLERFASNSGSTVSRACHWAIARITGKKLPVFPPPYQSEYQDWFLKPIVTDSK